MRVDPYTPPPSPPPPRRGKGVGGKGGDLRPILSYPPPTPFFPIPPLDPPN